jgi:hypothetical protein
MRDYNSRSTLINTYWTPIYNSKGMLFGTIGVFVDDSRQGNCMPDVFNAGYFKPSFTMVLNSDLKIT